MWGDEISLLGFIAANVIAASSGAVFKPGPWYDGLAKPWWNPPKWLFPVAWTFIFGLIATAGWLAWRAAGGWSGAPWAFFFYFLQLALNAGWSAIFFGMRRMDLAFAEVGALWLAVFVTTVLFFQVEPWAGWLMVPYVVWVAFAARLNHKVWKLNPDAQGRATA